MRFTAAAIAAVIPAAAFAAPILPFTEDFEDGASNWLDTGFAPVTAVANGGVNDSAYVTAQTSFEFVDAGSFNVVYRANPGLIEGTGASDGAFIGNWIDAGVTNFSFDIRHDIPVPATFFVRFAADTNGAAFPGAVAVEFIPAISGEWTTISIDIDPNSPNFVSFEGSSFENVFSNLGFIQIGVATPEGFEGTPGLFDIDLDNVSIVPAPAGLALLLPGLAATRRRRA